jgi:hypothetical protein
MNLWPRRLLQRSVGEIDQQEECCFSFRSVHVSQQLRCIFFVVVPPLPRSHLTELTELTSAWTSTLPQLNIAFGAPVLPPPTEEGTDGDAAAIGGPEADLLTLISSLERLQATLAADASAACSSALATRDAIIDAARTRCTELLAAVSDTAGAKTAAIEAELNYAREMLAGTSKATSLARRAVASCTDTDIVALHADIEKRLAASFRSVADSLPQQPQCDATLALRVTPEERAAIISAVSSRAFTRGFYLLIPACAQCRCPASDSLRRWH